MKFEVDGGSNHKNIDEPCIADEKRWNINNTNIGH